MIERNFLTDRENVRLATVLCINSLYLFFPTSQIMLLSVSWVFIQMCIGNAKRIPKRPLILYWIRMSIYFLPYLIPSVLMSTVVDDKVVVVAKKESAILLSFVVVLIAYFIWIMFCRKSIRILASKDYAAVTKFIKKSYIYLRLYTIIGAAICEEVFFRGVILSLMAPIYILFPLSTALFILAHWTLPWGGLYKKRDLITEFFISIINGGIYFYSHTIIPGIILHLLINCTTNVDLFLQYDRWHLRKKHYDTIALTLEQSIEDDLEI